MSDMFTHVQEMYEAQLISDPLGSITRNEAEGGRGLWRYPVLWLHCTDFPGSNFFCLQLLQ